MHEAVQGARQGAGCIKKKECGANGAGFKASTTSASFPRSPVLPAASIRTNNTRSTLQSALEGQAGGLQEEQSSQEGATTGASTPSLHLHDLLNLGAHVCKTPPTAPTSRRGHRPSPPSHLNRPCFRTASSPWTLITRNPCPFVSLGKSRDHSSASSQLWVCSLLSCSLASSCWTDQGARLKYNAFFTSCPLCFGRGHKSSQASSPPLFLLYPCSD